jgi:hypothetical protein
MLDNIDDLSGPTENNSPLPAGMLAWFQAETDLGVPNDFDREIKLMILEFKDTPQQSQASSSE